ncbi:reverse transcriptase [Plakobranchus ocellatus]|uniref:Reverse transcriptase n=1 Tax=Plakobranchus ocellatus TaxID=259542 RepID=A0AAV3XU20_9GAST|nr:reverse transcriptase [Plakobranchus ocellatus]
MVQQALRMFHISDDIQEMLDDNSNGFKMRFSAERYTTDWINLEDTIATGCTISPILVVLAMEVILTAVDFGGGYYMPPLKAFMDDTKILLPKENETRKMLLARCSNEMKLNESQAGEVSKPTHKQMKGRRRCLFQSSQSRYNKGHPWPIKSLGR